LIKENLKEKKKRLEGLFARNSLDKIELIVRKKRKIGNKIILLTELRNLKQNK